MSDNGAAVAEIPPADLPTDPVLTNVPGVDGITRDDEFLLNSALTLATASFDQLRQIIIRLFGVLADARRENRELRAQLAQRDIEQAAAANGAQTPNRQQRRRAPAKKR